MTTLYKHIEPAQAPDPNGFLFDLELQLLNMVRQPPNPNAWHRRFAWEPGGAYQNLNVRMPVDLTSFTMRAHQGFDFEEGTSTYLSFDIDAFSMGTHLDVRKLRDPVANEIIMWNQRADKLMRALDRFMAPKIYTMLGAGQTAISGGHPITGGAAYFATDHYVNKDHTSYGTFSNLLSDGGALASSPLYLMVRGGAFDSMKSWALLKGAGLGDAIKRAGGSTNAVSNGDPWIIKWGADSDRQLADQNMKVKLAVYQELGWGFLFPHTCVRYEGDFTYAGLKTALDTIRGMKDLDGYNDSESIAIDILCDASQVSTLNGLLGREVTDTGARQVDLRIDATLQGAAVIPMSR